MYSASFTLECTTNGKESESESCYLSQYDYPVSKAEIFGYDDDPKEILVSKNKKAKKIINLGMAYKNSKLSSSWTKLWLRY